MEQIKSDHYEGEVRIEHLNKVVCYMMPVQAESLVLSLIASIASARAFRYADESMRRVLAEEEHRSLREENARLREKLEGAQTSTSSDPPPKRVLEL